MAGRHRSSLRSLAKIAKAVRLRRCPFLANGGLLLLVVLLGCGTSHQATSPDATPAVGVNGIVRAERPPGRYSMRPPLEPGVQVAVISGPAQGSMVMTDANGAYSLQIPPGTFKLRASKAGFLPVEGAEQILDAGDHIARDDLGDDVRRGRCSRAAEHRSGDQLPNGSTPQLRILEGETGTVSLTDLGKYGFAPTFNGGVVVVEIFDLRNPQQRLGKVRAAVSRAAVQSSTKPQFGIRVIRVVIQ